MNENRLSLLKNIGEVMSNFDHEIDGSIEKRLKEEPNTRASYPGCNFYGWVWYSEEQYNIFIQRYHSHVETFKADTLQEIMDHCCESYGSD